MGGSWSTCVRVTGVLAVALGGCGGGASQSAGEARRDAFVLREMAAAFAYSSSACHHKLYGIKLTGTQKRGDRVLEQGLAVGEIEPPCLGALGQGSVAGPKTWTVTIDMQRAFGFERKVEAETADVAFLYSSRTTTIEGKGVLPASDAPYPAVATLDCPGGRRHEAPFVDGRFSFTNVPLPPPRTLVVCHLGAGDPRTLRIALDPQSPTRIVGQDVIVGKVTPPAAPPPAGGTEEPCTTAFLRSDAVLRAEPSDEGFELTQVPACTEICRIRDENGFAYVQVSPRDTGYVAIAAIGDASACP